MNPIFISACCPNSSVARRRRKMGSFRKKCFRDCSTIPSMPDKPTAPSVGRDSRPQAMTPTHSPSPSRERDVTLSLSKGLRRSLFSDGSYVSDACHSTPFLMAAPYHNFPKPVCELWKDWEPRREGSAETRPRSFGTRRATRMGLSVVNRAERAEQTFHPTHSLIYRSHTQILSHPPEFR